MIRGMLLGATVLIAGCAGHEDATMVSNDAKPAYLERHRLEAPVLLPSKDPAAADSHAVECPKVVSWRGQWWMFHTTIAKEGDSVRKRIGLAVSDDLINWKKLGVVLDTASEGAWDSGGISAPFPFWNGSEWWLFYDGFPQTGYEQGRSSIGAATSTNLKDWKRVSGDPILARTAGPAWDSRNLYQCWVGERGGRYWMYYNAANEIGAEQIGLAFSDDLRVWERYAGNPLISNGTKETTGDNCIAGDPWIVEIGGLEHLFYFGYDCEHARELVATSIDGLEWTKRTDWNPVLDIGAPGTYDEGHAHKPCLVEYEDVWYHFYTAEGTWEGETVRSIALATSKKLPGVVYRE